MMFIMWVIMVVGIGFWASKLNRNVFGYVVLAFLLSPLVAAIVLLIAGTKKDQVTAVEPQNPTINVTINNPGSVQPDTIVVPVGNTTPEVSTQPEPVIEQVPEPVQESPKPVQEVKEVKKVQNKSTNRRNKKSNTKSKTTPAQNRKDDTDVVDYSPTVYTSTAVETPKTHVTSVGGHSGHSVSHSRHDDNSSYNHSYTHSSGSDHSSSYDSGSSDSSSSSSSSSD